MEEDVDLGVLFNSGGPPLEPEDCESLAVLISRRFRSSRVVHCCNNLALGPLELDRSSRNARADK